MGKMLRSSRIKAKRVLKNSIGIQVLKYSKNKPPKVLLIMQSSRMTTGIKSNRFFFL